MFQLSSKFTKAYINFIGIFSVLFFSIGLLTKEIPLTLVGILAILCFVLVKIFVVEVHVDATSIHIVRMGKKRIYSLDKVGKIGDFTKDFTVFDVEVKNGKSRTYLMLNRSMSLDIKSLISEDSSELDSEVALIKLKMAYQNRKRQGLATNQSI